MSGTPLYEELLAELNTYAEPDYAAFHSRLLKNEKLNVLGVRVPTLRKMAKKYSARIDDLLVLPDDYYEITFIKLQAAALLPWEDFIKYVDKCVSLIDNWATCDCFSAKCIAKHREEFLPFVNKFLQGGEFNQRYALTVLLSFYMEERWLGLIFSSVSHADTSLYYVHMAAAWLIAEVLVKFYDKGVEFLKSGALDIKTHNKAIQKACESYRLTKEQKDFLRGLKR
ncbi:MAG: DNA alkylation repair protein [Clostridia bacterium]|nr:DNA alkylation repair protein [Clostridia bacterium]